MEVVEPDFLGIALVCLPPGEEKYIGLDSLGIENPRGQAQQGMKIALVHQSA